MCIAPSGFSRKEKVIKLEKSQLSVPKEAFWPIWIKAEIESSLSRLHAQEQLTGDAQKLPHSSGKP
jgi:hypothetical protein